jgi:diacylglycerol kinase (ATP)
MGQTNTGNSKFSLRARIKSLGYALEGIEIFFRSEPNAVLHLMATVVVICLGFWFHISPTEAVVLSLAVGFVWVAELFNTAVEKFIDLISTDRNPKIKFIKDVSAAAVLVAAITSLVTGCIIFIPKILK